FFIYDTLNIYRDFGGICIEDNFLITENSYHLLGKYLPKSLKEIEDLKG
ncbi:MAG: aminopeptidase P family protein, partial [Bacteroidetes bacterium]|nr:aminopeptidase P family protein [Bacteroidota bacterium]